MFNRQFGGACLVAALCLWCGISEAADNEEECLLLAYPQAFGVVGGDSIRRLEELLQPANTCIKLIAMPNRRSTRAFQDGRIDGEVVRTHIYGDALNGAGIRVPTPIFRRQIYLYTVDTGIKSLKDLAGRDVGYVSGFLLPEQLLEKYAANGVPGENFRILARLLNVGRVQSILVGETADGKILLPPGRRILMTETSIYMYLHQSRESYIDLFDEHIRGHLRAGGTFLPGDSLFGEAR